MLKLTRNDRPSSLTYVYISPKYITALQDCDDCTAVWTVSGSHLVQESVEAILAMPEMLNELFQMTVLPNGVQKRESP